MDAFVFFGKIVPERADLTIQNARRNLENKAGVTIGDIQVDIKNSQALILLNLNLQLLGLSMPVDFYTVKNLAYDQSKMFISLSALFLGGGFDIDIPKGFHIGSGRTETFAPRSLPIVEFINQHNKLDVTQALRATYLSTGRFIQFAIEDFSDALRIQNRNAMFLFYHSIESLRKYVGSAHAITDENKQWAKLREILGVPREDIDFIKTFADPVRHGDGTEWTVLEIERAERFVWKSIHDVILKS